MSCELTPHSQFLSDTPNAFHAVYVKRSIAHGVGDNVVSDTDQAIGR